jgi:hypothetical protein
MIYSFVARRMHAANGSYPYPRLAYWIRSHAREVCEHEWRYDADESQVGTGYVESCRRCGALQQVPQ